MRGLIKRLLRSERAVTTIEYGLICALIVLAMMASLRNLAGATVNMWTNIDQAVANAH